MFDLKPSGCCGASCEPCQEFAPPDEPFEAFAWDCLGVQLTEESFVLRRCCPISTPLLSGEAVGSYSVGQTPPFWQPEDRGPFLSGTSRTLTANRSKSIRLGLSDENSVDCSDEGDPATQGSLAVTAPDDTCARASYEYDTGSGPRYVTWSGFGQNYPGYVRCTQPDGAESVRVWYEVASFANTQPELAPWGHVVVWDLETGQNILTAPTEDYESTSFLPSTIGGLNSRGPALQGNGSRIAVGRSFRIQVFRRKAGAVATERLVANFDIGDRWQTSDTDRFVLYEDDGGANIWPACWQWDNTSHRLEVQHFGEAFTRIYHNSTASGRRLLTAVEGKIQPIHYQRTGSRHVFLASGETNDAVWQDDLDGDLLFDIDTSGGVDQSCPSVVPPGQQFIDLSDPSNSGGPGKFVLIGPEGEVCVVRQTKVQRLGDRPWDLTITSSGVGASISRGTYHGWYQLRGVNADADATLHRGHIVTVQNAQLTGTTTTTRTDTLIIHPDGPDVGVMTPRQYTHASGASVDPTTGAELMHFVGHNQKGEIETDAQWGLAAMADTGFASGVFGNDLPLTNFASGVTSDPTLPAHYGIRER